jgi:hypothetical protein
MASSKPCCPFGLHPRHGGCNHGLLFFQRETRGIGRGGAFCCLSLGLIARQPQVAPLISSTGTIGFGARASIVRRYTARSGRNHCYAIDGAGWHTQLATSTFVCDDRMHLFRSA